MHFLLLKHLALFLILLFLSYSIDEPNCCLMLCESICYMSHGQIVGIDVIADKEFLQSLELLIEQVKKY